MILLKKYLAECSKKISWLKKGHFVNDGDNDNAEMMV
jgi:hypothetical protein